MVFSAEDRIFKGNVNKINLKVLKLKS